MSYTLSSFPTRLNCPLFSSLSSRPVSFPFISILSFSQTRNEIPPLTSLPRLSRTSQRSSRKVSSMLSQAERILSATRPSPTRSQPLKRRRRRRSDCRHVYNAHCCRTGTMLWTRVQFTGLVLQTRAQCALLQYRYHAVDTCTIHRTGAADACTKRTAAVPVPCCGHVYNSQDWCCRRVHNAQRCGAKRCHSSRERMRGSGARSC